MFAEILSAWQKGLLADFRFRCSAIPGTYEIRAKIDHLGFWASVLYGNCIFMTVPPGERHNYLAIRMSPYRGDDPYADDAHRPWTSEGKPRLHPDLHDYFGVDIPGYDLRRIMLAENH